jgi:hypothetical protein
MRRILNDEWVVREGSPTGIMCGGKGKASTEETTR